MSSSLDMALDEIISTNKQKGRGGSRGGISKRGGSGPSNRNNTPNRRGNTGRAGGPIRNTLTPRGPRNSLIVSNLHPKVTEKDLYELFGQQGVVKRAFLHIAPTGKSAGVADIVFAHPNDAERAKNAYNNVDLDHRPMRIAFANLSSSVASSPIANRRGSSRGGSSSQRGGGSGRRTTRSSGNGRPRRENRPKPSQADLDAEMDTYMGQ